MLINCDWLPSLERIHNNESEDEYERRIYKIFIKDFIYSHPIFNGLPIYIRFEPYKNNRVQAFYHVTTFGNDQDNRYIDNTRQERIRWIRAFIEHSDCKPIHCDECEGMKAWSMPYRGHISRVKLLLTEEKYIVILEPRTSYILLITAYYVDYSHTMKKLIKEFEKAKSAST